MYEIMTADEAIYRRYQKMQSPDTSDNDFQCRFWCLG